MLDAAQAIEPLSKCQLLRKSHELMRLRIGWHLVRSALAGEGDAGSAGDREPSSEPSNHSASVDRGAVCSRGGSGQAARGSISRAIFAAEATSATRRSWATCSASQLSASPPK